LCDDYKAPSKVISTDRPKGWFNRTVLGAGITSALGDFCYETATVILPGLLSVLGIPAAALGIIEGIADAVAAFTKMVSGYIADKLGHRKGLVLIGYSLTPAGQALIALAFGWPLLLLGRIVSWFGKGLRGPLRDAIVIQAVSPETRGRAFGFHRAADTIGAVLGPLSGVALLGWAKGLHWNGKAGPFQLVLWLSLIPGALAVLAFLTLVQDPAHSANLALKLFRSLRGLPPRFKRYLGAVGIFGVGDFSHSLLILAAIFFIAGFYMTVQESLEPTVAAEMIQSGTLTIGYGALGAVNGITKFISSATVGVVWTAISPILGFGLASFLMAIGMLSLWRVKAR
jgi:MFS family permease